MVSGDNYIVIEGKQANSKLAVKDAFAYLVEKCTTHDNGSKTFYMRCRFKGDCPGRAVIRDRHMSTKYLEKKPHTCDQKHGSCRAMWQAQTLLSDMKDHARSSNATLSFIYHQCMKGQPDEIRSSLEFHRVRKILHDARVACIPASPDTIDEFVNKMESGVYPESYSSMYLGHVQWMDRGEIQCFNVSLKAPKKLLTL